MRTEPIIIKNHINGVWLNKTNGEHGPIHNPSKGTVIGKARLSSTDKQVVQLQPPLRPFRHGARYHVPKEHTSVLFIPVDSNVRSCEAG